MDENINRWEGENPWLGLESYNEGQHLYGRDQEATELTDIILNHTAVVVYGKSGIGKSSLLRAGVFPELRKQDFIPIYVRLEHNSDISYTQQIENAITEHVTLHDLLPTDIPDLGLWDFMHRHRFTDTTGHAVTPVVVLDQFEEIFTLTQVEYKPGIKQFFAQLADLLNDMKPDVVNQAEAEYSKKHSSESEASHHQGFTLQIRHVAKWNYEKSPSYRFVFSIRDDSLYLLERNSAKIPPLKVNRFNLNALDEESAKQVIMSPRPDLFTPNEGQKIIDELAYFEYDDFRVVDPAILSLFLYSYYREQGKVSSTDIFERYYENSTHSVTNSSLAFIEDHLLTDRGNRNQVPTEDIIAAGVTFEEIESLLKSKILKTEKRKGMDYIEFSHDRICEQATKHRVERKQRELAKKRIKHMVQLGLLCLTSLLLITAFGWLFNDKHQREKILSQQEKIMIQQDENILLAKRADSIKADQIDSLYSMNLINRLLNDSLIKSGKLLSLTNSKNLLLLTEKSEQLRIIQMQQSELVLKMDSIAKLSDSMEFERNIYKELSILYKNELDRSQLLVDAFIDGIDVCFYQKQIDWKKLTTYNKNLKFVYIKATEGATHVDKLYRFNLDNARKNGLKVGSYHFFTTTSSIQSQFDNFAKVVNKSEQDLLPVIDVEVRSGWTNQQLCDSLELFVNMVEKHYGCRPIIYTSSHFFNNILSSRFSRYPIYIAKYSTAEPQLTHGGKWVLWQFSDKGEIAGIDGYVNLTKFAAGKTVADIMIK